MPVSFFDTNVLVYLASGDAAKADRAEASDCRGRLDQRAGSQRTRQRRASEDADVMDETHALLNMLRGLLTVHPLTVEIHETGCGSPSATAFRSTTP